MSKKKAKGTELKWVPIQGDQIGMVPRHLLEQMKPRDWDVDRFYKLAALIKASPFNVMGLFLDKTEVVQGFMWGSVNPLDERFHVHVLSVDPAYQGKGIIGEAKGIINRVKKEAGLKSLVFSTIYPEKFERWGFKRSQSVMMEE